MKNTIVSEFKRLEKLIPSLFISLKFKRFNYAV